MSHRTEGRPNRGPFLTLGQVAKRDGHELTGLGRQLVNGGDTVRAVHGDTHTAATGPPAAPMVVNKAPAKLQLRAFGRVHLRVRRACSFHRTVFADPPQFRFRAAKNDQYRVQVWPAGPFVHPRDVPQR